MRRAAVGDVMTTDVTTISPDTPFTDIVSTFADLDISGAPVVGPDSRVLGVVSESDLLRKEEFKSPVEESPPRFESRARREVRERAEGSTAAEVTNTPAVTITRDTPVVEAARLMAMRGYKRLPVVDRDGLLAGIVTRGDLLHVFLRSDEEIRDEVVAEVIRRYLWQDTKLVMVDVKDGVVTLRGRLDLKSLIPIAVRLTSAVEGVTRVVDELTYDTDDTTTESHRYRRQQHDHGH
jgi:CBS domain-containing protein